MLKVPRLSRKRPRRQLVPVRRQASADIYGGTESVTPATHIQRVVVLCCVLPRLSRKRPRRQLVPVRRQASADICGGTESVTPATHIQRVVV